MSQTSAPTEEQVRTAVQREKQAGFIVHCKDVLGMNPEQIKVAHASYLDQDAKREAKINGTRAAILGQ